MRVLVLSVCTALFLSGCEHYTDLSSSDFRRGNVSHAQFERDNYECEIAAAVHQNMAGGGDVHGVYNDTYAGCMEKRGYRTTSIDMLGIGG